MRDLERIFIFGCSMTSYMWPTWANIIAYDKKVPFYNYADPGMGNVGIAHRVLEADLKHNFTDNDDIYILWSSWNREDRIKNDKWNSVGSVFNTGNKEYFGYFLRRYWSINNDIVKNSHSIISTNRMFKNIIWQGTAFPFYTTEEFDISLTPFSKQVANLYQRQMPNIELISIEKPLEEYKAFGNINDMHPDILEHLKLVEYIYSDTGQTLNLNTIDYFKKMHQWFVDLVNQHNIKELDELAKHMPKFYMEYKEMIPLMDQVPLNKYLPNTHSP